MYSVFHFFLPFCIDGKHLCLSTWLHAGQDDQGRLFIKELIEGEIQPTVA